MSFLFAHWLIDGQAGPVSNECADQGIFSFQALLEWLSQLPYGRNSSPEYRLVFTEECGTCSTKHALAKAVAQENGWNNVKLYVGLFEMSKNTHPQLNKFLENHRVDYLLEAHTYLKIDQKTVDITGLSTGTVQVENIILEEHEISPDQIGTYKSDWHKQKIKQHAEQLNLTSDDYWKMREAAIQVLANQE